ncbi:MarR family winged helix-turn-helix transcriptional regulator [Massilia norwichensis]|uniref:MarR family transcriptional regulator n=1 Tax=Massilia norwichensis TaxID=1442366 RepID=A0ABT2A3U6_9BURK|nr:MarR family transcriptional regulator [Massilia norwichensis]MCS0588843.1 MarR family transcriptional regulator [Massilia norwichensis]
MSDLPESPIEERFSAAVHNTARGWRLLIDKQLKHLGIGQAGWMTIAMVAKAREPMSQRALADVVGVEGPSMVSMLDRLEREGLVMRAPSPTDRRVKLVHLTEAGTALYKQVKQQANAVRGALLGDIDPAQLEVATELLELLRKRIEEQL